MARGGKLTKIKSVLKKMQSFKLGSRGGVSSPVAVANSSSDDESFGVLAGTARDLHTVYVGKSRRRYLVASEVVDNPLFRELVDRSSGDDSGISVGCEVVLFEHLLWMLENADPQPESLNELAQFYACC